MPRDQPVCFVHHVLLNMSPAPLLLAEQGIPRISMRLPADRYSDLCDFLADDVAYL
jgi:hypothetical protein